MSQDESSKREEERLNRTLNSIGRGGSRTARASWSVPTTTGLAGPVGGFNRSYNQATSLKAVQEQIREEERRQQQQQPQQQQQQQQQQHYSKSPSPQPISPSPSPIPPKSPSPAPQYYNNGSSNQQQTNGDDDFLSSSEKDHKLKLEEERLNRWMKKGDTVWEANRNERRRSISMDNNNEAPGSPNLNAVKANPYQGHPSFELVTRIQDQLHLAAKALRQNNIDDIVRHSLSVAATGKALSASLSNDAEILALANALESTVSVLKVNAESPDIQQHFTEVSSELGRLFISVIGAL